MRKTGKKEGFTERALRPRSHGEKQGEEKEKKEKEDREEKEAERARQLESKRK